MTALAGRGAHRGPLDLPLQHIGYTCKDIEAAVAFWTEKLRAGPFLLLDSISFERAEYNGEPARFDHTAAFGQWGDVAIELQQLGEVEPAPFLRKLDVQVNHVAYVSDDAERDSAELERRGMPMYFEGAFGEVHVRWHDVPVLGHAIEIHQGSEAVAAAFARLAEAADGWDGSDPLRTEWVEQ